jgi:ABC-2 type transport system permease protein
MARRQRVAAIAIRYFYLLRGSPARVVPLFAWVAIDIVLWGFMSRYLNRVAPPGFNFIPALLGAVLLWDFLIRIMQGVTMAFLEDVWSRNFLNIFATPLSISEYLAGLVVTSIATSAVGLLVMLGLASAVFGLSFFGYGLPLAHFVMVLFLFGIALGIFAAAVVLRLGPAAEWFIWPIPAMLSPLAGVFYPISTLPGWMQVLSHLLPPAYVFEGVRLVVSGGRASMAVLTGAAARAAVYLVFACWFFATVYRHALRTGLIARYSAESLS